MTKQQEIYLSIDIEATGACPGLNSMISLGAVLVDPLSPTPEVGRFQVNMMEIAGARQDAATMRWWETQPEAWAAANLNAVSAEYGMEQFRTWLAGADRKVIAVAYPAGFDFTYLYYYAHRFGDSRLQAAIGRSCIDIRTYAMGVLGLESFYDSTKSKYPKKWFAANTPHTHKAVDDALEQGLLFCEIWRQSTRRRVVNKLEVPVEAVKTEEQLIDEATQRLNLLRNK